MNTHKMPVKESLPSPETYEREYVYWPWGKLIEWVASWVEQNARKTAVVVDYMCGTGFLLNGIISRRPDLMVCGCSITEPYIRWAQERYRNISIVLEDAFLFRPPSPPDIILCTAGLHHLPRDRQTAFLDKIASELTPGGRFVIGEECIGVDVDGADRQIAVLDLWFALMQYAVRTHAPREVIDAAVSVMQADLFSDGEYKRSWAALDGMLRERFVVVESKTLWPTSAAGFGDCVWVCAVDARKTGERSGL